MLKKFLKKYVFVISSIFISKYIFYPCSPIRNEGFVMVDTWNIVNSLGNCRFDYRFIELTQNIYFYEMKFYKYYKGHFTL